MLLRKIGLHGFKSFADRLELSFEPGVTAIVGPNGSGKSNLADAVKWVLGESSARELRGSRMEDVIFAGSTQRHSLGLAEVTLTLDNGDGFLPVEFAEVSVTRRLYRSGDSEFLLNRAPCRLKDIQELFLDSGLGRNAYALLSQAEVEAVLSAHPEERRRLFEEAAGVAKFRAKKSEALRRLAETEQNLTRVGDILSELSTQLGPLAEKARRAERHAVLGAELKEVEVALLAGELQEAQRRVEEAAEELTRREMAAAAATTVVQEAEARVARVRVELAQLDGAREDAAREVLGLATEAERVEGQRKVAQERLERWRAELVDLAAAQAELAGRAEAAAARAEEGQRAGEAQLAGLAEVKVTAEEKTARLAEATAEVQRREAELERKKGELIEGMNEAAQLRNELRGLQASREVTESHRRRLAQAAEEAERVLAAAQKDAAASEERRRAAVEALAEGQEALQAAVEAASEEAEAARRVTERLREGEGGLARLRSQQQVLGDWARQREGYAEGPRAILREQACGGFSGVLGAVADLLRVPDVLERAVETALGASLQDVVVEDEEVAQRGIRFLKEKAAGRATFLPLSLLTPRPLPDVERRRLAERGGGGFLGVADDLVEYPERIRPAVKYLLGRVLVTRNLEAALRLGRASGLRYLVVTVEGDVVRPGGAVTGGREERSRGLLRRRRELAEVETALAEAEQSQAELTREGEALTRRFQARERERQQLEAALKERQAFSAAAAQEAAVRAAEVRQAEAALARVQGDLAATEASAGRSREEELGRRLAEAEVARQRLEEAITREAAGLREAAERREVAAEALTAARVEFAAREKEAEAAAATAARHLAEAEAAATEVAAARERATDLEQRTAEAAEWFGTLETQQAKLGRRRAAAEDRAAALTRERGAAVEALTTAESETEVVRRRQEEAQTKVHEAELAATRVEFETEGVAGRLAAEWGIDRNAALALPAIPTGERAAAADRAEALRRRLKVLGAVDPEAIGEYAALSERHGFLSRQYGDLTAARETLADVLSEIETVTTRRFTATFAAVQKEFAQLFRQVFGGGRAELSLTEPGHPAESGIEVAVQPPGKKNQSLLSLSSGERTMTALALLFAMLRVRPAPFCVLDEVDAALDEANLQRFVELLREFAAGMQFVVITHRRLTMEAAGILYGVTMEEPGTSQLVSVRLAGMG